MFVACSARLFPFSSHNSDKYLGIHLELWGFPSVLQIRPSILRVALSHFLDRHGTSMAAHILRRLVWSALRSGLFPRHALRWQLLGRLRHHDAQPEYAVLAGLPEPGDMHGSWGGAAVYSESSAGWDMVRQEAGDRVGYRDERHCCW